MSRKTRLPALDLAGVKDPATKKALSALVERQDVREGTRPNANKLDKGLTWRDLVDIGIVKVAKLVSAASPGVEYANPALVDFTTPPAPTNLTTAGALDNIILSWDRAGFSSYSYTEVLRQAAKDAEGNYVQSDPGQAVVIGTAVAPMYPDNIGAAGSYYYWVRFVNFAGVQGPLNAVAGTLGETGQDPAYMLEVLTGQITESQLYAALNQRLSLIDAPGTGLVDELDALATALLDYIPDANDRYNRLLFEKSVTDATVEVDPVTGEIRLIATADITTDVEARLNSAEFELSAQDARITANTQSLVLHDDRLTAAESEITTQAGQIALKASTAYVDFKTEELATLIDPEAAEQYGSTVPDTLLWLALLGDAAISDTILAKSRLAIAEQTLETHADELEASATARTVLAVKVDENAAAIVEESTVRADETGHLLAQYTVKFDVNGYPAGFGLASETIDGVPFSEFLAQADRFAIINPNTSPLTVTITRSGSTATATATVDHGMATGDYAMLTGAAQREYNGAKQVTVTGTKTFTFAVSGTPATPATIADGFSAIKAGKASIPFIVQDGKVYMDTALIKDATITDAMIGSLSADKLTVAAGTIAAAVIGEGDITNAMIGNLIQSALYTEGVTGWQINKDGTVKFWGANAKFGGDISAATGTFTGDLQSGAYKTATSGQRIEINPGDDNEMHFYADFGDGYIGDIATIGVNTGEYGDSVIYRIGGYKFDGSAYHFNTKTCIEASSYGVLCARFSSNTNHGIWSASQSTSIDYAGVRGGGGNNACGVYGVAANGYGVRGSSITSFDFYASGAGANYGPFTGAHDGLIDKALWELFEVGDIVRDDIVFYSSCVSQVVGEIRITSEPNDPRAVGVFVASREISENNVPAAIADRDDLEQIAGQYFRAIFNALGEGMINVCGENGDIQQGDLIVTSSVPGKGMRQGDNVLRNYTVARARQSAIFDAPGQVKQIACIYLCG